ncbi:MAG: DUF2281 domain-containing protein [Methylococcales bacterium]|nr:DUF2281 domain-containing protein [Methylococcales bacterium]
MRYLVEEIAAKTAVLPENLQQEVLDFVEFVSCKQRQQAETALLSEQALAEDWIRPEEEEAWAKFQ